MMLESEFRPYAATANVMAVLSRARTRNLPEAVTNDFLRLTGVPDVVYGRVTQALLFLDLVHEDGRPTDKLQAIAGAPEDQYRQLLADCIRAAYRDDFGRVDPEQDPQGTIIDAFRRYKPRSQTARMVMLFLGLCREAAIPVVDAPRERKMQPKANGQRKVARDPSPSIATPNTQRSSITEIFDRRMSNSIFSLTEQDLGALDEGEFNELWMALGKVARARARRAQIAPFTPEPEGAENHA